MVTICQQDAIVLAMASFSQGAILCYDVVLYSEYSGSQGLKAMVEKEREETMSASESNNSLGPKSQNAPPQTSNSILGFIRFYINTIKEALLHPLSTSTLDKRTGRVIARNGQSLLFDN
ncbi:MAG: hypothetical protein IIB15_07440 [Chloroflexi bacterium]|nr:hypothetical protein [Chloroflexota bacterium]